MEINRNHLLKPIDKILSLQRNFRENASFNGETFMFLLTFLEKLKDFILNSLVTPSKIGKP